MKRLFGVVISTVGILGILFLVVNSNKNETSYSDFKSGSETHIKEISPIPSSHKKTTKQEIIESNSIIERANEIVAKMPQSEELPEIQNMKMRLARANEHWLKATNELSQAVAEVEKVRFQLNQRILDKASPEEIEALNQELIALVETAQWKEQEMLEAYREYMTEYEAEIEKLTLMK